MCHAFPAHHSGKRLTSCEDVPKVGVIGLGSYGAGDDALGIEAAKMLHSHVAGTVDVRTEAGDGINITSACRGLDALVIIDALKPTHDHPPGSIVVLSYPADRAALALTPLRNTHSVSLACAIALAEQLEILPESVTIFGMAGASFAPGFELSEVVKSHLNDLVHLVLSHLAELGASTNTR